ncbi:hypothetical protein DD607_05040 [Salmonella sp. 3DZ2-4SM]|uniref:DUF3991 and TOPRIM domain-containing protein n=1 Tax=Mammaliicoccus sciuri TaxID=1296 RepID=A0A0U2N3G3_MAMSC|nr:DUF3991 and TOPRIM domain-containing protein [Mammaliicoccus sciuri]RXY94801.1 hypothetical protein DD607_05040 [Salmonella sp. 3DZ2-4SM]ALI92795.1 Hypothetical protein [Mammaliicoccus sciuri]AQW34628.1 hypothetical protein [Mammaliicoccus sciuri]AQW34682.1 hypothetical protein [Mammaliicoccus sciuri]QRN92728.1 DUF3991 and TOPRIM domain-containing protein [Mammaliicoccus sciuri]
MDKSIFDKAGMLKKEAIEHAKTVSIVEYLESEGYVLQKQGDYYRMQDHDSLVINAQKNVYKWNSRGSGGTVLQLLQEKELFNMNFREAVIELNKPKNNRIRSEQGMNFKEIKTKEPYAFPYDRMKEDTTKVRDYLVEDRKIDPDLVDTLLSKGLIRQDKNNNAVYPWISKGSIVGHNAEGSYVKEGSERFKFIASGGDTNQAFSFQTNNGKLDKIYFFEGEADALSYATLNGLEPNSKYVSMRGVNNDQVIAHQLGNEFKAHKEIPTLVYCVDNDQAGLEFIQRRLQNPFVHHELGEVPMYFDIPPKSEQVKDWNDLLIKREGKTYSEFEKSPPLSKNEVSSFLVNKSTKSQEYEIE